MGVFLSWELLPRELLLREVLLRPHERSLRHGRVSLGSHEVNTSRAFLDKQQSEAQTAATDFVEPVTPAQRGFADKRPSVQVAKLQPIDANSSIGNYSNQNN